MIEKQTNVSQNENEHHHGNLPVILFLVGVILFILGLVIPQGMFKNSLYFISMLFAGYHIIEEGVFDTIQATKKNKKFMPNVHILMTLAAIGAMLIGDFQEGALLIVIFAGAHFLEEYAEGKSKREITNLLKMNPTEGRLINSDGSIELVDVTRLKIGDQVKVLNGDQIPTDGVIVSGGSTVDESSINGESIPAEKGVGDEVFGSTINGNGSFIMEVTKDSNETLFAKIIEMVNQSQSNMTKTATKIQKIEPKYVKIVLVLVPMFIIGSYLLTSWGFKESFYRGMVFLTVASPCALAASAVPATLSAVSNLAKRGVLFKGGSYLSNLADVQGIAFDKTGTLTEGKPQVTDFYFTNKEMMQHYIDIIISMEKTANHPLASAILAEFEVEHNITVDVENELGKGLVTNVEGTSYRIGKPETFTNVSDTIADLNQTYALAGKTVVYFSEDEIVVGLIAMMDVPNEAAKSVISYLKNNGIHTTMITGDSEVTGQAVGKYLGMDEIIGNVLPENKAAIVTNQQAKYGIIAMLGDGVNDAPALVQADIGIAMGNGTDIAIDVADAVLMQNDLTKVSYAHKVARRLDKIVWQNIYFSLAVVILLVVLNIFGKMDLPLGVIAHEGSTILVILNGLRLLLPIK